MTGGTDPAIGPDDLRAARTVPGPAAGAVGPARCLALLRGITSPDPQQRWETAEAPADLRDLGGLDAGEGRTLGWVLAWAAVVETVWYSPAAGQRWSIREGLMTSLVQLAADGWAPAAALRAVVEAVPPAAEDAVRAQLVEARSWPALPDPPPGPDAGTSVGAAACLAVVARLVDDDPDRRSGGALTVAEWAAAGQLDDAEAATLAAVLAWAARVEGTAARVDLLGAVAAVAAARRLPPEIVDELLAELPEDRLTEVERSLRWEIARDRRRG